MNMMNEASGYGCNAYMCLQGIEYLRFENISWVQHVFKDSLEEENCLLLAAVERNL